MIVMMPATQVRAVGAPARIDAEHAVDTADGTAHCASDDAADRAGDAVALAGAALHPAGNALRLGGAGERECREARAASSLSFMIVTPRRPAEAGPSKR